MCRPVVLTSLCQSGASLVRGPNLASPVATKVNVEDNGVRLEVAVNVTPQATQEALLPLPIGSKHKFSPLALGVGCTFPGGAAERTKEKKKETKKILILRQDVANVSAHIVTGKGKHGFDDRHRGQMMVVTGK